MFDRRTYLAPLGAGGPSLAGCAAAVVGGGPPTGSVEIENDHREAHDVTVTVVKDERDWRGVSGPSSEDTPESVAWRRTYGFAVPAGESVTEPAVMDEAGWFHVTARLAQSTGLDQAAKTWVRILTSGEGELMNGHLQIRIQEGGQVVAFQTGQD